MGGGCRSQGASGVGRIDVGEAGGSDQVGERHLPPLEPALEVGHLERRPGRVAYVEPGGGAGDGEPEMEPGVARDVHRPGESGPAVQLPIESGVEHRRVLHRVGQAGLVLPEVDVLAVQAVGPELNPEEAALGRGGDVHVHHPIPELEVLRGRRTAVEHDAAAAEVVGGFRVALEHPVGGVG